MRIIIEERFGPNRTILVLEFEKKTNEENKRRKTNDNIMKIYAYLEEYGESKTNDIAHYINLSPSRTRAILSQLDNIESIGTNTNRKYESPRLTR